MKISARINKWVSGMGSVTWFVDIGRITDEIIRAINIGQ